MATPVKIGVAAVALNLALNLAFMRPLQQMGPALATSLAAMFNLGGLAVVLARRGHLRLDPALRRRAPRMLAAAGAMAVVLLGMQHLLGGALATRRRAALGGAGRAGRSGRRSRISARCRCSAPIPHARRCACSPAAACARAGDRPSRLPPPTTETALHAPHLLRHPAVRHSDARQLPRRHPQLGAVAGRRTSASGAWSICMRSPSGRSRRRWRGRRGRWRRCCWPAASIRAAHPVPAVARCARTRSWPGSSTAWRGSAG